MKNSQLYKGSLNTIIMKLLEENGKMYGYEITQKVKALTQGELTITEGALYPALHKLEAEGLLDVEIERVDNTRDEQDRRDDRQAVGENEQPLRRGHDHTRKRIQKRYDNVREKRLRLDVFEAFFQFLHWACSRKLERFVFLYFTRKNRPVNKNGADRMMI